MAKLDMTNEELIDNIKFYYDGNSEVTTKQIHDYAQYMNYTASTICNRLKEYRVKRGVYQLREQLERNYEAPAVEQVIEQNLVPEQDPLYVPFGNYLDVKKVIKSGIFYPVFITGLSGNGKTHMVEQACAQLNREFVRVNITIETDEDDLLGGFRLADGDTVWHDGPVVDALKRGAVLLLDELDLASNKIMCLQPLLEGKGVYLKKINEYVKPADGFQVIATANTKGRGCDDGKFIGTNVLNEAFLERFAITLEQDYPSATIEAKILTEVANSLNAYGVPIDALVKWAGLLRSSYNQGDIEDVITTRRLINIVRAYAIWNDVHKAIQVCTNRFDDDTKKSFKEFYEKVSGDSPEEHQIDVPFNEAS